MLCEPKVRDFDVAIRAQQQVFRLEIPVDDVQRVEVVQSEGYLCGVELGYGVGEALLVSMAPPLDDWLCPPETCAVD